MCHEGSRYRWMVDGSRGPEVIGVAGRGHLKAVDCKPGSGQNCPDEGELPRVEEHPAGATEGGASNE